MHASDREHFHGISCILSCSFGLHLNNKTQNSRILNCDHHRFYCSVLISQKHTHFYLHLCAYMCICVSLHIENICVVSQYIKATFQLKFYLPGDQKISVPDGRHALWPVMFHFSLEAFWIWAVIVHTRVLMLHRERTQTV